MRQSIVHVDHDDIVVEGDEEEFDAGVVVDDDGDLFQDAQQSANDTQLDTQSDTIRDSTPSMARTASQTPVPDGDGQRQPVRQKVKISYEQYTAMVRLLMQGIDLAESGKLDDDEVGLGASLPIPEHASSEGITKDELVEWYLNQRETQIATVEQLAAEQALAKKIVDKMIQDNMVMVMRGEGLNEEDSIGANPGKLAHEILVRHPNNAS